MKPRANVHFVLVFSVLTGSLSSIFVRWASAPALVTASWRLIWTVALLAPVVLVRHRKELLRITTRDIFLCGLGGVFLALHFMSWFESLNHTTVAIASTLVCTDAIFAAIGFALFLKGKIPRMGVVAIGIAFAGSVVLAAQPGQSSGSLLGGGLALMGAIFVSCYILIGRVQRGHLSTSVYTFLVYSFCCAVLLLFDLATGTPLLGWGWREPFIGLLLGVFCTLLGHSLVNWCLKYLSPVYVSSVKLAEPIFASILAIFLFGEIPRPQQLLGGCIIVAGILLFTQAEGKAARQDKAAQEALAAIGEEGSPTT